MKRCALFLSLLLSLACVPAVAQQVFYPKCPLSYASGDVTAGAAAEIIAIPTVQNNYVYINGVRTANPLKPTIHICSIKAHLIQTGTPGNYGLVTGTGTNCATGQANLTPQFPGTASVTEDWTQFFGPDTAPAAPSATAVCLKLSAAVTHSGWLVTYGIW